MKTKMNWKIGFIPLLIAFVLIPLGNHYYTLAKASQNWSPEILFCKDWKTVCDPSYTDPNHGCAPLKVCADQSLTPSKIPDSAFSRQEKNNLKKACEQYGGKWLDEFNECENFSSIDGSDSGTCQSLGGEYLECTSACRHNPKAESCIGVCVPICKFN